MCINSNLNDKLALLENLNLHEYRNTSIIEYSSVCFLYRYYNFGFITFGSMFVKNPGSGGLKTLYTIPKSCMPKTITYFILHGNDGKPYLSALVPKNEYVEIHVDKLPTYQVYLSGQMMFMI